MAGHRTRAWAIAFAVATFVSVVPMHASAGPRTSELTCAILADPQQLSELDAMDFAYLMTICPGAIGSVKSEEKRERKVTPTRTTKSREDELKVHRIRPGAASTTTTPVNPIDAAAAGNSMFSFKQENSVEIHETPTSRTVEREEETKIRGEGFNYKLDETTEENEDPNGRSVEEESEEHVSSR